MLSFNIKIMTQHYDEYKGSVCDCQVVNHMTYQSLQLEASLITDPFPIYQKKKQMTLDT